MPLGEVSIVAETTVTDVFGRHPADVFIARFDTGDTTAPDVISVTPVSGTSQAPVTTSIVATFNEPISTDGASNIVRLFTSGGGRVQGQTTVIGAVVTFKPDVELQQNARYTYTIYGAKDLGGQPAVLPVDGRVLHHRYRGADADAGRAGQ